MKKSELKKIIREELIKTILEKQTDELSVDIGGIMKDLQQLGLPSNTSTKLGQVIRKFIKPGKTKAEIPLNNEDHKALGLSLLAMITGGEDSTGKPSPGAAQALKSLTQKIINAKSKVIDKT